MKDFVFLSEDKNDNIITLDRMPLARTHPGATLVKGKAKISELDNLPSSSETVEIDPIVSEFDGLDGNHVFVKDCDYSKFYGDTDENGAFLKENLFSELTSEYLRLIARRNLGITDDNALIWGNITGNLLNQKDLVKFVSEYSVNDINKLIEEINLKLSQWGYEIDKELKNKAPIESPLFIGTPTTTTPEYSDNSNKIPTTGWVKYLIDMNLEESNLSLFTITPESKLIGLKVVIQLKWDFLNPIEQQWINDKPLDANIRSLDINSINQSESFTLKWIYEGKTFAKTVRFKVIEPFYAGISSKYNECKLYENHRLSVNAGINDYIYVYVPENLDMSIRVNGIEGGFSEIGYIYIVGIKYSVYRSDNKNLGLTYIDLIDNKVHYEGNYK